MNKLTKIALSLAALCGPGFAQTAFTTTTLTNSLSAKSAGNSGGLGSTGLIAVGSTTAMYGPGLLPNYGSIGSPSGPNITYLVIDGEMLRVNQVPSATQVGVQRGVQGTKAVAHNAGATVYIAYAAQAPNSPELGACVAANLAYLPVYSYTSRDFWTCPTSGPNANVWTKVNTFDTYTFTDASFFVAAPGACVASLPSGSGGTGNNTIILDGSVPALKASSTASAATLLMSCTITVDSRLTANKGLTLTSIDFLYSPQTTTATSQVLSTMSSFTGPAPAASETATSATLTAAGGTITQVPATTSANLTAINAGQYYTSRASFATPIAVNNARQTFVFTFSLAQSASSIQLMTSPGFWVNATSSPL